MPRPRKIEKSKDFKSSLIKLIKSLKKYYLGVTTGLILAIICSVLSIILPNRLSDITDYITEGLKPNTVKLQEINETIFKNAILNFNTNYSRRPTEDEEALFNACVKKDKEAIIKAFYNLKENTLNTILSDIEIDNTIISKEDQLKYFKVIKSIDRNNINEKALTKLDELPESIYNLIKPQMKLQKIKELCLILTIILIISAVCNYFEQIIMAINSNKYGFDIRKQISNKINKLPLKYFDNHEAGNLLSRVTNDVDTVAMNLSHNLSSLIANITLFIGSIIMMFITNPTMAISGILASMIGFIFMFMILNKSQKYFIERQEQLGDLNGYVEEIYSAHNIVTVYNGIDETNKEFDKLNEKLYVSSRKSQFLSGIMQPLMGFVGNLGYVTVCVVGALLVSNNKITFGVIVAFMIYVRMFTRPLSQIAQSLTSVQSTVAAGERVFEFLEEQEMIDESNKITYLDKSKVKGHIEFKNVKFGYNNDRLIIKNFNASIKPGEKIAIVGPTGAGKTTIVNLLMKFYEINSGDILIDDVSIKELTRENIHDLFVMVLQDTWLFEGTIKENIKYKKKDTTDEEIWKACKIVGIDHFIKTLPKGLDAEVGDNENISAGQKQLITIARGMIENAPFLILDEATSNVDTRTEELVQKAMDKLTKGKTSFIIAHRLSTIKNADLILVMNEGNIIEQGTHQELMNKNGFYKELYNSQFKLK